MIPIQPARVPTDAEKQLRQALHHDARTHLGRMFAPAIPIKPNDNKPK